MYRVRYVDRLEHITTPILFGVGDRDVQCAPEVVKTFQTAVIDPVGAGPAEYARVIAGENERMAKAGKVADLKAE